MMLAVTGSLAAIAHEVGARSPQTVAFWKDGTKKPEPAMRARIYSAFGIPVKAWSVPPGGALDDESPPDVATTDNAVAPGLAAPTTLQDVIALLNVIRRDRSVSGILPSERVKLAAAEARILQLKAQLEQKDELSEARYVAQHAAWLRARKLIVAALEPHPIAAQAVLDALQKAGV